MPKLSSPLSNTFLILAYAQSYLPLSNAILIIAYAQYYIPLF